MGCSIFASVLFGLRVNWSDVCIGFKKVKAFEHDYPKDWTKDPKSGKDLWIEQPEFIDGWDDSDYPTQLHGYDVLYDMPWEGHPTNVFICLKHVDSKDLTEHDAADKLPYCTEEEKKEFIYKVADVFRPEDYGVWLYCHSSA